MSFRLTILIISFLITSTAFAQPEIDWMRTYGEMGTQRFYDIYTVSNGGYIMCGDNSVQTWLVRIDDDGETIWSQTYRGLYATSIIETDGGNFIACVRSDNTVIAAVLVDADGEELWFREYVAGIPNAIIELKSGEYVLAGGNHSVHSGYMLCINRQGDIIWETDWEGSQGSTLHGLRETDGGIVAGGWAVFEGEYPRNRNWVVKVDFDGEHLWSQIHIPDVGVDVPVGSHCSSIASRPRGGFALTGHVQWRVVVDNRNESRIEFMLMAVDDEGDVDWVRTYGGDRRDLRYDEAKCINRMDNGSFMIVGYEYAFQQGTTRQEALCVTANGVERWNNIYNFPDMERGGNRLQSVVQGHDNSIVAAGYAHFLDDSTDTNGLVIKLEPDLQEPLIIYHFPEDTLLTILQGDTINFLVRAQDQQDDELTYLWIMGEDTLSRDTTTTVIFEELGDFDVQCQVSDGEFTAAITWHITVAEWFVQGFTPDSLALTIRRGLNIDFALDIAAIEGVEPSFLWTLIERNQRQREIGTAESVNVTFDLAGDLHVTGAATHDGQSDEVRWNVQVRSSIYSWWPSELDLSAYKDSTLEFVITPFNEDSDSLEYVWLLDGELIGSDSASVLVTFPEVGQRELTSIVYDGVEADTISWMVDVEEWSFTADFADFADFPTSPILFPASPNPFNSSVKLSMYLPKADHVSLSIFDVNGREVSRLVDGNVAAGSQTFVWNASNFPAGVYVVRMDAGDALEMRKVVLVR